MIRLPIKESDVIEAKEMTKKFDAQKTYNKVESDNNFLGILSEKLLHMYFDKIELKHEWINFIKQGWNNPDFIINNKSIDLKCTHYYEIAIENPKFDWYIFSRTNKDLKELFVIGYINKEKMIKLIKNGKAKKIETNGRIIFYTIQIADMKPMEEFPDGL